MHMGHHNATRLPNVAIRLGPAFASGNLMVALVAPSADISEVPLPAENGFGQKGGRNHIGSSHSESDEQKLIVGPKETEGPAGFRKAMQWRNGFTGLKKRDDERGRDGTRLKGCKRTTPH